MCKSISEHLYHAELEEAVLNSDQKIVGARDVHELYDIKSWMKPYIDTPHGHTNPHNFLFRQNRNGRAEMLYRNWSSDPWLPAAPEPGKLLLKVSSSTKCTVHHVSKIV